MSTTKHFKERMDERNISSTMVQIAELFGVKSSKGDKVILNKDTICSVEKNIRKFLKDIENLKKRGGLTLVESEGLMVTTYFNDSYKPNKRGGN